MGPEVRGNHKIWHLNTVWGFFTVQKFNLSFYGTWTASLNNPGISNQYLFKCVPFFFFSFFLWLKYKWGGCLCVTPSTLPSPAPSTKHPFVHRFRFPIDFEDLEFEIVQFVSVVSNLLWRGNVAAGIGQKVDTWTHTLLVESYQVLLNLRAFAWFGYCISFVTPWNQWGEKKR